MYQALTLILTPLLTASLTLFVNQYVYRVSYKNDYYKKIIETRMSAYSKIWDLIQLFPFEYDLDDPYFNADFDEKGKANYNKIYSQLRALSYNGTWLSLSMQSTVIEFYKFIASLSDEFQDSANEVVERMIKQKDQVDSFRLRVISIYYIDLEKMYDVPLFFLEKKSSTPVLDPKFDWKD